MTISEKGKYALRAMFELAQRYATSEGPVSVHDIATAQYIPKRFLEIILSQLRQGGFVESRRGKSGGYRLARRPSEITMGQILDFMEGPLFSVDCKGDKCPLSRSCVFTVAWDEAREALERVFNKRSLADLVEESRAKNVLNFVI